MQAHAPFALTLLFDQVPTRTFYSLHRRGAIHLAVWFLILLLCLETVHGSNLSRSLFLQHRIHMVGIQSIIGARGVINTHTNNAPGKNIAHGC